MKEIKMNCKRPVGICSMCNKRHLLHFHHIIPKRYKIKTKRDTEILWGNCGRIFYHHLSQKIEHLMIPVCLPCHKKLHAENFEYHKNEWLLKKKEFQGDEYDEQNNDIISQHKQDTLSYILR